MCTCFSYLPAPTQLTWDRDIEEQKERANRNTAIVAATKAIPPYGSRSSWVPRNVSDFGDWGSFPEISTAQYPLDMGRKGQARQKSNALAIQLDAEGKIKYDSGAKQRIIRMVEVQKDPMEPPRYNFNCEIYFSFQIEI